MNIPEISWRNSIFSRLMITLLFVMIPIYILGFIIYNWGMNTIRTEIINSNSSQVTFVQSNFENEITRIKYLQYGCLDDRDLLDLSNKYEILSDFDRLMAINRLERVLYSIKNSSKYVSDVKTFIPGPDIMVSALGDVDKMDKVEYDKIKSLSSISPSQIYLVNNNLIIPSNIWINGSVKSDSNSPLIVVELSKDEIRKTLNTFNDYRNSGYIVFDPVQKYSILGSVDSSLCEKLMENANKGPEYSKMSVTQYKSEAGKILVFEKKSGYLNMILIKFVAEDDIFSRVKEYRNWFFIFTFVSLVIILFASLSSYKYIHKPLQSIVKAFYKVQKGEMDITVESKRHDEFGYLYRSFNTMVDHLRTLIDQVYKQRILAQKAELKQLQSQINPHFLFNSFFIISTLIKTKDYTNASEFTNQLGEYFQFITRSAADEVSLKTEVEHARVYVAIQSARFGKRIRTELGDIPEEAERLVVPRLILQPMIENSFEHGLHDIKAKGRVRIQFGIPEEGKLLISVEDNGTELEDRKLEDMNKELQGPGELHEVTGMVNIHRRIQLKFGPESGLYISRSELGGLKAEIRIVFGGDGNVQDIDC